MTTITPRMLADSYTTRWDSLREEEEGVEPAVADDCIACVV
jgi:hypothetical protein